MKDRMIYMHAAYDCLQSIEEYIKDFGIEDLQLDFPSIQWSQIAGMRNIIAHEYLGVDKVIIWETAINHLEPIKIVIEQVLVLHKKEHQEE